MKTLVLTLILLTTGCTGLPVKNTPPNQWQKMVNTANSVEDLEAAAVIMEHNDYIRYRQQAVGQIDRRIASTPPTDLEREAVYFLILETYLITLEGCRMQFSGMCSTYNEKALITMRKILDLPKVHAMSRYAVARLQELNGENYSSKIQISNGASLWEFTFGITKDTFILNDFSQEYSQELTVLEKGKNVACFVSFLCLGGLSGTDDFELNVLKKPIGIRVHTKDGFAEVLGERNDG